MTDALAPAERAARRLSWLVVALLLVISGAGLARADRLYDAAPALRAAFLAQDVVTLALALPLLVVALRLAARGSLRGRLLWAGLLAYVAYWYWFYVVGARFNVLFLAYAAVVAASLLALAGVLASLDVAAVHARLAAGAPRRATAGFLVATAVLFAALWSGDVVRRLRAGAPLDLVSRAVYAIDLVVLLPAMAVVGVLLWRGRAWGAVLAAPLLVKAASSGVMLLAGTAAQAWAGTRPDPAPLAGYALVAAGGLAFTVLHFRALGGRTPRPPARHLEPALAAGGSESA